MENSSGMFQVFSKFPEALNYQPKLMTKPSFQHWCSSLHCFLSLLNPKLLKASFLFTILEDQCMDKSISYPLPHQFLVFWSWQIEPRGFYAAQGDNIRGISSILEFMWRLFAYNIFLWKHASFFGYCRTCYLPYSW